MGVAQKGKKFEIEGVDNPAKIESDFLTTIRSKDKFNHILNVTPKNLMWMGKRRWLSSCPLQAGWLRPGR